MADRTATINRETKETQISLSLDLDGSGSAELETGVGFLDHMLTHIAKHGMFDLSVEASGDYEVDDHHTVEDVGICLGQALAEAVGDKRGIVRYGSFMCPMDEALVTVALDLSGRPFTNCDIDLQASRVGTFDTELVTEFFRAVASNALMTLHVYKNYGHNTHHIIEAAFKAFGRALDQATSIDPRREDDLPSTKGTL
ncbi:MAG: imidazoleglycerol-phosphate dehydratase HisB [Armatimonadota bacterium]